MTGLLMQVEAPAVNGEYGVDSLLTSSTEPSRRSGAVEETKANDESQPHWGNASSSESLVGIAVLESAIFMATNQDEHSVSYSKPKTFNRVTRYHPWGSEFQSSGSDETVAGDTVASESTLRTHNKNRPDSYFFNLNRSIRKNWPEPLVKQLSESDLTTSTSTTSFRKSWRKNCITRVLRLEQEMVQEDFATANIKRGIEIARLRSKKPLLKTTYDVDIPREKMSRAHPQDEYAFSAITFEAIALRSGIEKLVVDDGNAHTMVNDSRVHVEAGLRSSLGRLLEDTVSVDGNSIMSVSEALPPSLARSLSQHRRQPNIARSIEQSLGKRPSITSVIDEEPFEDLDMTQEALDSFMTNMGRSDQSDISPIPSLMSFDEGSSDDTDDDDDMQGYSGVMHHFLDGLLQQVEFNYDQSSNRQEPALHLLQLFQWTDNKDDERFSLNRSLPSSPDSYDLGFSSSIET
jgi:hypothetical protein